MAYSNPVFARSLIALLALLPAAGLAILPDSKEPIALEADSSEFDKEENRLIFQRVRITQAGLSIAAETAVADGLDFSRSVWTFTGGVNIDGDGSHIRGSTAQLVFTDHRLVQATTTGEPATFDREADPEEDLRALSGNAESIEYDAVESTLLLSGSARLLDGANEITGDQLLYNIIEDKLIASSDDTSQVRVIITPQNGAEDGGVEETPAEDGEPQEPDADDEDSGT